MFFFFSNDSRIILPKSTVGLPVRIDQKADEKKKKLYDYTM